MAFRLRKAVAAVAMSVCVAGGAAAVTTGPASAAASCAGAGYLCFYDYNTAQYGNVAGNNSNWGAFGWNDRADWFYNQGTSCSVRVYQHASGGGSGYSIARGNTLSWANIVSSNYWC